MGTNGIQGVPLMHNSLLPSLLLDLQKAVTISSSNHLVFFSYFSLVFLCVVKGTGPLAHDTGGFERIWQLFGCWNGFGSLVSGIGMVPVHSTSAIPQHGRALEAVSAIDPWPPWLFCAGSTPCCIRRGAVKTRMYGNGGVPQRGWIKVEETESLRLKNRLVLRVTMGNLFRTPGALGKMDAQFARAESVRPGFWLD
ncbi:hypothetical protein LX36DRAFT_398249 [Colletotrichum falcatum]|nr:hypothetical protein LX36DRAFT_398249 [Colletotrichum falcatum]